MPNPHADDRVFLSVSVKLLVALDAQRRTGEGLGDVIGRLAAATTTSPTGAAPAGVAVASPAASLEGAMTTFLTSGGFLAEQNPTEQFLAILAHAIAQQPGCNAALIAANRVFGGRTQFGDEADVARSGVSTRPRQVPGTSLFTLTNLSTEGKRKILGQALQVLGYTQPAIAAAKAALGRAPAASGP
jgi:negative regulator of replication initiation